ncbi:MAG TPA: hypothetical protein P5060_02100 [Candidatus Absconditabacterales bacterium]|nr:hypothetical protein [Candidatus Absconditabacterales bacterium]
MKSIITHKTNNFILKINNNTEFLIYLSLAFLVPFVIGGPQLLVGSLVNCAIILAGINLNKTKMLPIILLPSVAVMARGLIFGPFTIFLLYLAPFIRIGNRLLANSMKLRYKKGMNIIIGISAKVGFLFLVTVLLIKLNILPDIFAKSMGLIQLYTAAIGAGLALVIQYLKKKI